MIIDNLKSYRIILASRSPRRQQLLRELGLNFDVIIREYAETFPEGLNGEEIARYISSEKAASFKNEITGNEIVITADTIMLRTSNLMIKPAHMVYRNGSE